MKLSVTTHDRRLGIKTYRAEQDRCAGQSPCCRLSNERFWEGDLHPLFPETSIPAEFGGLPRIPRERRPYFGEWSRWAARSRIHRQAQRPFASGGREEGMRSPGCRSHLIRSSWWARLRCVTVHFAESTGVVTALRRRQRLQRRSFSCSGWL